MEFDTARTVVYPWQCDGMGHLATQNYMRVFDDATYHLLAQLGYDLHDAETLKRGWADVSHAIEYRRELRAGDLIVARSGVTRLGRTSLTYRTRLVRPDQPAQDCAVLSGVAVYFDLEHRKALEIPAGLRATATAAMNS